MDEDERLRLGEFGIQTRLVRPPQRQGAEPTQGEHGHTMVYSATQAEKARSKRSPGHGLRRHPGDRLARRPPLRARRADGHPGPLQGLRLRARRPQHLRRHAELRRSGQGDWQIVDLGSTNGVKVNGTPRLLGPALPGDEVTLGNLVFNFDIEQ